MIFALSLTGPTASGKTALSLALAERLGAEIISSDSMQIYKGMNIGTAKATAEEQARVKHHLIDFLDPRESYSVERYRTDAMCAIRDVHSRGRLPMLVGGTGLYVSALVRGSLEDSPESSPEFRESLLSLAESDSGKEELWQRLLSVDPESAEKIHKNNVKRVIRALEIYEATGRRKSELDRETRTAHTEVCVGMITLDFHSRDTLYSRVDKRVDIMMEEGLLSEVEGLYREGMLLPETTAAQAIGYKELIEYIEGRSSLDCAVESIKLATRRYAKRQLTWFRHVEGAKRIFADSDGGSMKGEEELLSEALSLYGELLSDFKKKAAADA